MSVLEHQDYRYFLKTTLAEKSAMNSKYSLRAMARKFKMSPSYLSAILKGKKSLSQEKAYEIATQLNLKGVDFEYFCLLAQIESTRNQELKRTLLQRAQALNPKSKVYNLSVDHFRVISDWYHFAILRALELETCQGTSRELSKLFGLSISEVELALDRLERLEMVEKSARGQYRKNSQDITVTSEIPNEGLRKYHRQTLQKAIESLETQKPKEKVIGSETLCIDSSQIPEFKKLIDGFFSKAITLSKNARKKNHVYHLGVQFFNLTTNRKEMI